VILEFGLNSDTKDEFSLSCDSSKINQVLFNLIDNAIKFSSQGTIIISAAMHNATEIILKIEDSGIGIDPDIKDKLFAKFVSKSNGGTGLGLFLSQKIVEAHGGRILAANNPSGIGATFSFTLPTDLRSSSAREDGFGEFIRSRTQSVRTLDNKR